MAFFIALLAVVALAFAFLPLRAIMTNMLLVFGATCAFLSLFVKENRMTFFIVGAVMLGVGLAGLWGTIYRVEPSKRGAAAGHFILYGFWCQMKFIFYCTLILAPVAAMCPTADAREKLDADLTEDYADRRRREIEEEERELAEKEDELNKMAYRKYGERNVELNRDGTFARFRDGGEWVSADRMDENLRP